MIPKILIEQSITLAVKQNWHLAIDINLEILQYNPAHIPTLNRLAKAYRETNQLEKALLTYQQALKYDKYNSIAQKNLKLIQRWLDESCTNLPNGKTYCTNFIDEPGITRTLTLVRLGDPHLLSTLEPGQIVKLCLKNHTIFVVTHLDDHVGALTDDITYHLKRYLNLGYRYTTTIKQATSKRVAVFIRETSRPNSHEYRATFCF